MLLTWEQVTPRSLMCPPSSQHYRADSVYKLLVSVTQSCLTAIPWIPPGSSVHGVLQARMLEQVAIPFSRRSSQGLNMGLLHCRQILYHLRHQGSPNIYILSNRMFVLAGFQDSCMTQMLLLEVFLATLLIQGNRGQAKVCGCWKIQVLILI